MFCCYANRGNSVTGAGLNFIQWLMTFSAYFVDIFPLRGLSPRANYTDRAAAAKLVPTFAGIGVLRGQRNGSPRPLNSVF